MLVIVTDGSQISYNGETFNAGDVVDVSGELLEAFITSGAVVVKPEKKAKKSSKES